jgi:hypothetical protein
MEEKKGVKKVIFDHLRAVEAAQWEKVEADIDEKYQLTGVLPFPLNLFVKIGKSQALDMHKARKRALPNFKFNEDYLEETPTSVKIQVNLTGTHTGTIDYRGLIRGIPVIEPTGKEVKLNPEWFTYYVQNNKIVKIVADIPKNSGVHGLVKAVSA